MSNPFNMGPLASERNPPITPQYYSPKQFFISDISIGSTTTVTTTVDHDYVVSQLVRLIIPNGYGTTQLNEQTGYVISIPAADQVVLNIDSKFFDTFNPSYSLSLTLPQIIAIGDIQNGTTNANGPINNSTFIPGSFINISPQ